MILCMCACKHARACVCACVHALACVCMCACACVCTCCSGVHDVHWDELHDTRADARDGQQQEDAALYEYGSQGLLVGQPLSVQEANHVVPVCVCVCVLRVCLTCAYCIGTLGLQCLSLHGMSMCLSFTGSDLKLVL